MQIPSPVTSAHRRRFDGEDVVEVREVEVDRIDVDVAASVDGDLAPAVWGDVTQVGVPDARSVGFHADQIVASDERASIQEPVGAPAAAPTAASHDFTVPVEVNRDDLVCSPAGEP